MTADVPRYYAPPTKPPVRQVINTDLCVYGGTSGGVVAAVQGTRMGKSVIIAEFGKHLGGLTSSGLGATDIGNKSAIGGISREFYQRLGKHYGTAEHWTFEPHVAEQTFREMLREAHVPVRFDQRLLLVRKEGTKIKEIVMEDGTIYRAKVYIDATYEGDLMARAGVSYTVGREANSVYGETFNGVQTFHPNHNFYATVDPYVVPGVPESGIVKGISDAKLAPIGSGDKHVQAYNFRMCLTKSSDRIAFPKPQGYDPSRYELLKRYILSGHFDVLSLTIEMPNGKTDTNNFGAISTDNIGGSDCWPESDYVQREAIFQDHVNYQQGLMWFLANDKSLPDSVRKTVSAYGLPTDEFVETGGWPHQLYIREARRMISNYVMTEAECTGKRVVQEPVGMAAYTMDSHNCQRILIDGVVRNEGNVEVGGFPPYPISFRSIVPKPAEVTNLVVPVCLSASHIAYGSIRMEPVFMVLGQSAATIAAQSIDERRAVQRIDYEKLKQKLLADKQVLK